MIELAIFIGGYVASIYTWPKVRDSQIVAKIKAWF